MPQVARLEPDMITAAKGAGRKNSVDDGLLPPPPPPAPSKKRQPGILVFDIFFTPAHAPQKRSVQLAIMRYMCCAPSPHPPPPPSCLLESG